MNILRCKKWKGGSRFVFVLYYTAGNDSNTAFKMRELLRKYVGDIPVQKVLSASEQNETVQISVMSA